MDQRQLSSSYCMRTIAICHLLVIFTIIHSASTYNLEARLPLFKYGPELSKFGFSVAQHRTTTDDATGVKNTLLVIGAPTASAINSQVGARTPKNPGGVFYCPVSTDPLDCTRVDMDAGGDISIGEKKLVKSNQWLGVSLKSQGPGGFLISCAHRFTQHLFTEKISRNDEVERMCGKCFLLNATRNDRVVEVSPDSPLLPNEFISSPCDSMESTASLLSSKRRYGYMQAGTSISLHADQYMLGAPGTWAWTGAVFDMDMEVGSGNHMAQSPTCFRDRNEMGSLGVKCKKIPVKRDSYMGFSVATSDAIGTDSDELYYATGAPRGNDTGVVMFFQKIKVDSGEKKLEPVPIHTVVGEAIGSSFGYAIALTDINGDGLDDLIVGAPQYYEYSNKRKRGGAIYIYENVPRRGFSNVGARKFYGPLDSFFGHSIEPLGDIDQDGYNDFAVGAPYENENGTVHIFRGAPDGRVKESQTIKAEDFTQTHEDGKGDIVGFGASLSGQVDADSNKYPDLLIGSLSDHVALLRSRPIIEAVMSLDVKTDVLDLEDKNCAFGGKDYSCFEMSYCFRYTARHKEYPREVKIEYKLTLDDIQQKKRSARVNFDSPTGPSVIESKYTIPRSGKKFCPEQDVHTVYFSNGVKDKLSDIGIKIEFNLDWPKIEREEVGAEVFPMIEDPILDADLDKKKTAVVKIKTTCGSDGCQSNLKVSASMPKEVEIGEGVTLPVTIVVSNDGEEAHEAFITMSLPPRVDFDSFSVKEPSTPGLLCYAQSSGESSFIRCDLGNPYKPGMKDEIVIPLGVSRITAEDKNIELQIGAHTSSENPEIPPVVLKARVMIELDISLIVFAQPEQVRYKETLILGESGMKTTEDIGPLTIYTFNVRNEGNIPASDLNLNVQLPAEIHNGKWLLYLVTADVNDGGIQAAGDCGSSNVNVLQLEPSLVAASTSGRSKREAESLAQAQPEAEASSSGSGYISKITLACDKKNTRCINIKCNLDEIPPLATTSVVLQIHVWEPTFLEEFKETDLVYIQTHVNISTDADNIRFKEDKSIGMVQTTVDHEFFKSDVTSQFPWWYILIGIILLLIIYVLIIVLLVKCGFFRRKKFPRPENENDRTVLVEEKEYDDERI
ncbi:integrin alpha-6-like [Styela clava]